MSTQPQGITLRAFILGAAFAALFAWLTVVSLHRLVIVATATQIPVLPYALLFLMVLLLNPLLRLIRVVRPFTIAEVLVVFVMGLVSSGISTFGLADQLIPITGSLFYKDWNTEQAQWDRYIHPYLNDRYFLGEDGIQAAAQEYRDALDRRDDLKSASEKASQLAARTAALKAAESLTAANAERDVELAAARDGLEKARAAWQAVGAQTQFDSLDAALAAYPPLLAKQDALVAEKKRALKTLEDKAFAKVEPFRRGLPKDLQAYPGILPMPEDDAGSYFGRLNRLIKGRGALSLLREADGLLAARSPTEPLDGTAMQQIAPLLHSAAEKLAPLDERAELNNSKAALDAQLESLTGRMAQTDLELSDLNRKQRWAPPAEQHALESRINQLSQDRKSLTREKTRTEARLNANARHRQGAAKIVAVSSDLRALEEAVRGDHDLTASAGRVKLGLIMQQFPAFDASFRRYLVGDVPWSDWAGPLLRWGLLMLLTYIVLMTFNVLIFRQWAHNEKLIYPLVELPEILVGHKDSQPGMIPEVFRSGLFWLGFMISAVVLGWNLLSYTQLVPGIEPLDLKNYWTPYIQGTVFKGLLPSAKSALFFTMIGLSFLIPAKVSFSLWFFWLAYMGQLLVMVWLGYGENEDSFPKEWYYTLNFCSAEGSGALLVFATAVLYKCRRYLFCAFSSASVRDLALDEQKELRVSSFFFLAASVGLMGTLWLSLGCNPFYTVFFYAVIMVVTIGLVRAVAEGGILGFQCWSGPFHLVRNIFGLDQAWSAAPLFTPLMFYYSVFFLDIKTFIAPAMANVLKVREDLRLQRGRFHLAIWSAIAVAAVVAVVTSVMMCYAGGANAMNSWFYAGFPQGMTAQLKTINQTPPDAALGSSLWIATGAGLMALLLHFRQTMFWLPHPIGMIMLVNPIISSYWFSLLLGWLAKSLVTRYGNRETYTRARALFIGLIVGELMLIILALIVSYHLEVHIPIDLNRSAG